MLLVPDILKTTVQPSHKPLIIFFSLRFITIPPDISFSIYKIEKEMSGGCGIYQREKKLTEVNCNARHKDPKIKRVLAEKIAKNHEFTILHCR